MEPGIDLPCNCEPVSRLVAAESQGRDVGTNICLKPLEVANRQSSLLAILYRLICPKSDSDAERDNDEFADR